jgi:RHS repeat-associated protein
MSWDSNSRASGAATSTSTATTLGRRVLVCTRRDGLCYASTANSSRVDCTSGIERFVWAGDNILWEMRGPGANNETAERLEQVSAVGVEYGIVGYTHAGGVDRPLVAYKTAGGNSPAVVVPHMNWRGLFSRGTTASGAETPFAVEWPGFRTTAWHYAGETQAVTKNWMGSLLEEQRDAGGLLYKRNRYYDPKTGQFTQADPIGLAGGLNTYGFAAGDPVTNYDPDGLAVCGRTRHERRRIEETYSVDIAWDNNGCVSEQDSVRRVGSSSYSELQDGFLELVEDFRTFTVSFSWSIWHPRSWQGSRFYKEGENRYIAYIDPADTRASYWYEDANSCRGRSLWGVHALIAHELTGHGLGIVRHGRASSQQHAIEWENRWNRNFTNRPDRSFRCHP